MSRAGAEARPYSLSEDDYMRLFHALRQVRFIEHLTDAARERDTVEIELVGSAMHQLGDELERVMVSLDGKRRG